MHAAGFVCWIYSYDHNLLQHVCKFGKPGSHNLGARHESYILSLSLGLLQVLTQAWQLQACRPSATSACMYAYVGHTSTFMPYHIMTYVCDEPSRYYHDGSVMID